MESYSYKGIHNLIDKVRRFYKFSPEEIRSLLIVILTLSFIVGFNDGRDTSSLVQWSWNFFVVAIIIAFSILASESAKRIAAMIRGYKAEFRVWWYGLLFGIVVAILSNGYVWLLLPGGMYVSMLERHRLGKFRYGMNYYTVGGTAFAGPCMYIVIALLFKLIGGFSIFAGNPILHLVIAINLVLAICTGLCIPPMDGTLLMFASRVAYGFWYILLLGAALLIWLDLSLWVILFGSLVIGIVGFAVAYSKEKYDITT